MKKITLLLTAALMCATAGANVVSPYTVDFNTAVDVSATDFRAAPGWGHLVSTGAYPAQKVTYTYVTDGGMDGSGCIQAGDQYYDDWWTGSTVELNDLLVLTGLRRAVALQTLELSWGDWEEFRAFLTQRIDEYVDLRKRK